MPMDRGRGELVDQPEIFVDRRLISVDPINGVLTPFYPIYFNI